MVFFQEIIYLKNKGWGLYNKSWWIFKYRHTLDCFICRKNEIVYFNSFGVQYIPEEIKEFIEEFPGNKNFKDE